MAHPDTCNCFMCKMKKMMGMKKKVEGYTAPVSDQGMPDGGDEHKCNCGHDHSKEQCDCHK